jgi:hypothetical protein
MRNEVLRDVLAGCVGVLAVAAVIGLPKDIDHVGAQSGVQHAVLLPDYSRVGPPPVPWAPGARMTTRP